ncbi:MAG: plasmid mobilization protein [Janthinobacterium lividum]
MADTKTLNLTMSQEQYAELQRLAQRQGMTLAAYLRQALDLTRMVVNANAEGQEILFKDGNSYQKLRIAS